MNLGGTNPQVRAADPSLRSRLIFVIAALAFPAGVWVVRGTGFGITAAAGAAILLCAGFMPERWRAWVTKHPPVRWSLSFVMMSLVMVSYRANSTVWSVLGIVFACAIVVAWTMGYTAWTRGLLTWPNRRWLARTATIVCLGFVGAFTLDNQGGPVLEIVTSSAVSSALIVLLGPRCWARLTAGHPRLAFSDKIFDSPPSPPIHPGD
jgi:hypothetical protein